MNIITNTFRRKLGLNKIDPAPYTIKMADQKELSGTYALMSAKS